MRARRAAIVFELSCAALFAASALAAGHAGETPARAAIYDVRAGESLDEPALVERLRKARFLLLGEVHDNAEHHRIRARLIAGLTRDGQKPAVALETFDLDRDARLRAAQATPGLDAEALADAGELDRSAWRWPLHKPVLDAAVNAGLPVHAANLSRASLQRAIRAGEDVADGEPWARRLRQARWTTAQEAAMEASIEQGHCGKLRKDVVPRIAWAQRVRDAAMAQAMVDVATRDGAILLAGNGHVRKDIGVPAYLPLEPARVSVGLIETTPEERSTSGSLSSLAAANPGYDYLWFTGIAERTDPCEQLPRGAGK
jgi:uncharacterized iron-regulated protein